MSVRWNLICITVFFFAGGGRTNPFLKVFFSKVPNSLK